MWYDWGGLNESLFLFLHSYQATWWRGLMLAGTEVGYYKYAGLYAALLGCWSLKATWRGGDAKYYLLHLVIFCLACALTIQCTEWLKDMFALPRPYAALPGIEKSVHMAADAGSRSFPSGHSSHSAAIAASLWPLVARKWRWALVMFPLWVGLSRITLGVHFPADLVYGWALGLGMTLLVRKGLTQCAARALDRAA